MKDLNLPAKALDYCHLLKEGLIDKNDCLKKLGKILSIRLKAGIEDNADLVEAMRRIWDS